MVAALYVDKNGIYSGLSDVEIWYESMDARKYHGPYPVVAHPPCQKWGALSIVNYARWGGTHNTPNEDDGCFYYALRAVNVWGGVLEHPAKSRAWKTYGLKSPRYNGWVKSGNGWVCEVWQSAYGHKANKATWLYYRGLNIPFPMRWQRPTGSHQVGFHDQRGKNKNKPTLSTREANATPVEFRDELIRLAIHAKNYDFHPRQKDKEVPF